MRNNSRFVRTTNRSNTSYFYEDFVSSSVIVTFLIMIQNIKTFSEFLNVVAILISQFGFRIQAKDDFVL